jgi:hypothetical protein
MNVFESVTRVLQLQVHNYTWKYNVDVLESITTSVLEARKPINMDLVLKIEKYYNGENRS